MPDYELNPPLDEYRKRQPPVSAAYAPFDNGNPRSIRVTVNGFSATTWVTPDEARSLLEDIDNALTAEYRASQAAVVKAKPHPDDPIPAASGGVIVATCCHCKQDITLTAGDLLGMLTPEETLNVPVAELRANAPWRHAGTGLRECQ